MQGNRPVSCTLAPGKMEKQVICWELEKGPGGPGSIKLNMSHKCSLAAKKGNNIVGCIRSSAASRVSNPSHVIHTWSAVSSAGLPKKVMGVLESAQQRAAKMEKELEELFCVERLREVGMFNLGKRRLRAPFWSLWVSKWRVEDRDRLFSVTHSTIRPNGYRSTQGSFWISGGTITSGF